MIWCTIDIHSQDLHTRQNARTDLQDEAENLLRPTSTTAHAQNMLHLDIPKVMPVAISEYKSEMTI